MTRISSSSAIAAFVFMVSLPCVAQTAATVELREAGQDRVLQDSFQITEVESIPVIPPEPDQLGDTGSESLADNPVAEILRLRDLIRRNRESIEGSRSADLERVDETYRSNLAAIAPKDMFETEVGHRKREAREKSEAALQKAKSESEVNRKHDGLLSDEVEPLFQRAHTLLSGTDIVPQDAIKVHLEKYDPEDGVFLGGLTIDSDLMKSKARIVVPMKRESAKIYWKNKDSLIGRLSLSINIHSLGFDIEEFWLEHPQSASRTKERITVIQTRRPSSEEQQRRANGLRMSAATLANRSEQGARDNRSGETKKARGWISEYNRLVDEAKSVFAKDPHVQALKTLSYMGSNPQAAGAVATAARGLEAYLTSFLPHDAFKASASLLAKRSEQGARDNRSGETKKARGWISEYNRLVDEAKSVFAKDPHVQALKTLSYMGSNPQAAGAVATAARGLEAYLTSFLPHDAFKASASLLAKRSEQGARDNRSGETKKARGWISEYNRLVDEAKSVFAKDPHVQALKTLSYMGSNPQAAGAVATAARTFERMMGNVEEIPREVVSEAASDTVSSSYTSLDYLPYSGRFSSNAAKLSKLLGRKFSLDARDENGWTDLHYAAALNLPGLASALLDAGADSNTRLKSDGKGFNAELTGTLSAFGRDLTGDDLDDWTRNGQMPLHFAAWFNADLVAPHLVASGSQVDEQSRASRTPLYLAAWQDSRAVAEFLIGQGVDVQTSFRNGWTPLDYATYRRASETAALLRNHGGRCRNAC